MLFFITTRSISTNIDRRVFGSREEYIQEIKRLSMFQIMINEQDEDEPLKVVFVYNKKKYKEESVARFAEIFNRKLADLQTDGR